MQRLVYDKCGSCLSVHSPSAFLEEGKKCNGRIFQVLQEVIQEREGDEGFLSQGIRSGFFLVLLLIQ